MFGTKSFATAESVTCGHPDKACDQVADAVLDAILSNDPEALVGCEVTASPNEVHIMGEITTQANPDYERIARSTLTQIGYTSHEAGFDAATCAIDVDVHGQSPEIVRSVSRAQTDDAGAGDQGVVFGYATDETDSFMPMPIALAHKLVHRMDDLRTGGQAPDMLPDGKAQVSVEYENGVPARVSSVVLSAQTRAACDIDTVREYLSEQVVRPVIPEQLADSRMQLFINPTGRFTVGGPAANTGLSGRKNMVDTYGSAAHSGGSSLAGKDRSIAAAPIWHATSPRTSSRPAWPNVARCVWRTPSDWPIPFAWTSTRSVRALSQMNAWPSGCSIPSTYVPRLSFADSTCAGPCTAPSRAMETLAPTRTPCRGKHWI